MSQWHLSKLIGQSTGKNFNDLLNSIRINRAKELLKHTPLQIKEISLRVGFTDVSHFVRVFKKQEGERANQYRNRLAREKEKKW